MHTEAIFGLGKNEHYMTGTYHILDHFIYFVPKKTTITIPHGGGK